MRAHRRGIALWSAVAVLAGIAAAVVGSDAFAVYAAVIGLLCGWRIGDHLHELDQLKKKL